MTSYSTTGGIKYLGVVLTPTFMEKRGKPAVITSDQGSHVKFLSRSKQDSGNDAKIRLIRLL